MSQNESPSTNPAAQHPAHSAGLQQFAQGDFRAAAESFAAAATAYAEQGRTAEQIEMLNNLAVASRGAGQLDQAAEALDQAVVLAETAGDERRLATLLANRGFLLRVQRKPDEAIATLNRAVALFKTLDDPQGLSEAWLTMAQTRFQGGKFNEAVSYYRLALEAMPQRKLHQQFAYAVVGLLHRFTGTRA